MSFAWSAPTGACTFSLSKYRVVYNDDHTPTSITDGTTVDTTNLYADVFVHRSQRPYFGRVYACDNLDCSNVYGDDAGEDPATNYTADTETAQELWVVKDVGPTDTGVGVVVGYGVAPSVFWRPTGWNDAGKLAIYYDDGDGGIEMMLAPSTGWASFNTVTWPSPTLVSQSHPTDTDYDKVGHSYPYPVTYTSTKKVQLLAQNNNSSTSLHDHVVRVESTDQDGDDFGLYCASCCAGGTAGPCDWPTYGEVEICADESGGCDQLSKALHGRWMWDFIADGVPDLDADEPSVLFSAQVDNVDCSHALYGSPDYEDIFLATWNIVTEHWDVDMDSGCPVEQLDDVHDPGVLPLPNGEFKVYVMDWLHPHSAFIYYWDGSAWEADTAEPKFIFDDVGETELDPACFGNMELIPYVSGGNQYEGMFFDSVQDGVSRAGDMCGDGSTIFGPADPGIYFAELSN